MWLDRNLGATQVATSSTDSAAYGDLYQWGRATDGHQSRTLDVAGSTTSNGTTNTTMTRATSISSVGAKFIKTGTSPFEWIENNTQDGNNIDDSGALRTAAWANGGANDICPSGFSVPTEAEITADTISATTTDITSSATAFSSFLKIPVAGYRDRANGALGSVGSGAGLWSRSAVGTGGRYLGVSGSLAGFYSGYRVHGFSVRCIKD
ncbi:hypothetical protein CRYPA_1269 [uncultured Candidatus Thioglobus sp.]|nr:hypothetical protein CRYPA_1269 [uncultured Candidatus Thioglobus sp.]